MGSLNVTTAQLAQLVNGLLFREAHGLDLRRLGAVPQELLGVAAAANVIIGYLASGGVTPIGPPKKRMTLTAYGGKPGRTTGLAATGGVTPIGPPKRIDTFVAGLVKGISPVPRLYPDLSAWVQWRIPAELRTLCLFVAAAQFQTAVSWADDKLAGMFDDAAAQLFGTALGK